MMKDKFDEWSGDAQSVLEGQDILLKDFTSSDEISCALFEPAAEDYMVQELLQLIFKSFSLTMQRLTCVSCYTRMYSRPIYNF